MFNNKDSQSVHDTKKSNGATKNLKTRYVMESREVGPRINPIKATLDTQNINPRSFKSTLLSPYRNLSPEPTTNSPRSIKSINRTPMTIDLTKIEFPKLKSNDES